MRIYKGDVGMELTVQAFLDLLEEDALDEAINMVLDLEAASSLSGDFDGDLVYVGSIDLDGFDGDIESLFDHITENIESYDELEQLDLLAMDELFGNGFEHSFLSDEELLDNLLLSNEDLRVKRIVKRFGHID